LSWSYRKEEKGILRTAFKILAFTSFLKFSSLSIKKPTLQQQQQNLYQQQQQQQHRDKTYFCIQTFFAEVAFSRNFVVVVVVVVAFIIMIEISTTKSERLTSRKVRKLRFRFKNLSTFCKS
jgi:hypothetical protein